MRIFNFTLERRGVLLATASVDHGNGFITHQWKVLSGDGGLSVFPPQIRAGSGFLEVLEFGNPADLDAIRSAILAEYEHRTT